MASVRSSYGCRPIAPTPASNRQCPPTVG